MTTTIIPAPVGVERGADVEREILRLRDDGYTVVLSNEAHQRGRDTFVVWRGFDIAMRAIAHRFVEDFDDVVHEFCPAVDAAGFYVLVDNPVRTEMLYWWRRTAPIETDWRLITVQPGWIHAREITVSSSRIMTNIAEEHEKRNITL